MKNSKYILGIDTSNYKTSVAVVDDDKNIICDYRRFLEVKQGGKGLRQSDALFQHIRNLPELAEKIRESFDGEFSAVAFSSKPRPAEGSYMPVFLAGKSYGRTLAAAMNIPFAAFSHQEGHIEAIKAYSELKNSNNFLACHFSGGTCEVLEVSSSETGYDIDIIGGSLDISMGQVIDRAGVAMGMKFPSGEKMDRLAMTADDVTQLLTAVKVKDCRINLSGIDTQIKRRLSENNTVDPCFIREIFIKLSDAASQMLVQASEKTGINDIIMAGGVSSSCFIRENMKEYMRKSGINLVFDDRNLAQDNAVGTALLGGRYIWR
ncbi:MAG: O-sialoglycoprotein endopeptidase [Bacillota bacterium]|nr:O-sialoglycoprotein endopeptidase [Bacillota bacterium]